MSDRKRVLTLRSSEALPDASCLRIGKFVGTDGKGQSLVVYAGQDGDPVPARLTSSAREKLLRSSPSGREVLLWLEDPDSGSPVIIDTIYEPGDEATKVANPIGDKEPMDEAGITRKKRIVIDAEDEVVVCCGEASINLTRSGKIVIKGSYLVSRASGTNSIKGSSIRIN
jgi:hypothetical protein